jgi:hypothetical protein
MSRLEEKGAPEDYELRRFSRTTPSVTEQQIVEALQHVPTSQSRSNRGNRGRGLRAVNNRPRRCCGNRAGNGRSSCNQAPTTGDRTVDVMPGLRVTSKRIREQIPSHLPALRQLLQEAGAGLRQPQHAKAPHAARR